MPKIIVKYDMYVNIQKMNANYILDFVLFINNVSVCVPKSVDFILSIFFELISFEFNTLEIILKKAKPNGIYGLSS
ncbi:hypothetical protein NUBL13785_51090 [Klebsiella pneumoniae]|nr:hypothetical protein NUBL13785_51090 [Klebsiella pneumoniae]